jgi:hypothetical protein
VTITSFKETLGEALLQKECDELKNLLEYTFDMCNSNREELYWLICILRGLMNIPNKCTEPVYDNYKINAWQYKLDPYIEKYKKRWYHSNKKYKDTVQ